MHTTADTHCETLSAWFDGEPASRDAVMAALATEEGRAFLVDAMALRQEVDASTRALTRLDVRTPPRWGSWLTAAAAAAVCVMAGYGMARFTLPDAPPVVTPDTRLVVPVSAPIAPQPTHVIRFESGVDWRETVGGN